MGKASSYSDLTDPSLKCRSLGHAWDPEMAEMVLINRRQHIILHLTCMRCSSTRKVTVLRATGARTKSSYKYSDGYLLENASAWGTRRTINNNMRIELIARMVKEGR